MHQHVTYRSTFGTPMTSAAGPLVWRFKPLTALLLLVGTSPLRRHALPAARFASPSGLPNCHIQVEIEGEDA
jgi:hypothetical protein